MFQKVKQNRVFQDVVEQIQEAIISGKLKPGDHLPAERELKENFNVSRGTLREALRVLEQRGLIQIKTGVGGGPIVKDVSTDQMNESLGLLIRQQKVSLGQLAEFREFVEGPVTALAAKRATAEDVTRLKNLLKEAGDVLQSNDVNRWNNFIRLDELLHMEFANISGNQLFMSILQTVSRNIHTYYESFLAREEPLIQENYRDLIEIVAAIENKDSTLAGTLAQDHVRRFNSYMEKKNVP